MFRRSLLPQALLSLYADAPVTQPIRGAPRVTRDPPCGTTCPASIAEGELSLIGLTEEGLRWTHYRLVEVSQSAVCNKFHLLKQRFCRWILTVQDRSGDEQMELTQEALAAMVGARRPVVASLIGEMQDEGLVRFHRGCLTILDRPALQRLVCECYGIMSDAVSRFIAGLDAARQR